MTTIYRPSPINRNRRTHEQIRAIKNQAAMILNADPPMTLRGLFYQLVSVGVIPKNEREYKKLGTYLLQMRREGDIPYHWVADGTRWMRKPRTHIGLLAALEDTRETYRRAIWREQGVYVEIWIEKEALAGVVASVTSRWDVPLMVSRGFASESYLWEAAEQMRAVRVPCFVYVFSDYDPSGLGIAEQVRSGLERLAPDVELTVERLAVTPAQITAWQLPTRPTKATDSRSKNFEGESVELDAIPAAQLRTLVNESIEQHIDTEALRQTLAVEEQERETLAHVVDHLKDVA
ncbi:hypothetical protein BH23CHL5_BH23CHL5_23200 [soil metagenome]